MIVVLVAVIFLLLIIIVMKNKTIIFLEYELEEITEENVKLRQECKDIADLNKN